MKIINPIITGFNSEPSIIRVKDTYYIATILKDHAIVIP